jgi:hydroxymethylpyrimidine pyrophosphatase-like HAD family hydrolase
MYCRVIACDFDGTGAVEGHPAPELYAALAAARAQGIVTLLVTDEAHHFFQTQRPCLKYFEQPNRELLSS